MNMSTSYAFVPPSSSYSTSSSSSSSSSSSGWSWRQRFHAFLLRRALGPIFHRESHADLHRSVNSIDWSAGTLVLVDVQLDPVYLTNVLWNALKTKKEDDDAAKNETSASDDAAMNDNEHDETDDDDSNIIHDLAVHKASIRRFEVRLDFIDDGIQASKSSAAYALLRGMFGGAVTSNDINNETDETTGMALRVHVTIDKLDIVLAPSSGEDEDYRYDGRRKQPKHEHRRQDSTDSTESNSGFFSSLFDAAMRSLRLSTNVTNVSIQVHSSIPPLTTRRDHHHHHRHGCWLDLHIASARYYDALMIDDVTNKKKDRYGNGKCKSGERMVVSKVLDWDGITVHVGNSSSIQEDFVTTAVPPMLQCHGRGQVKFRVFQTQSKGDNILEGLSTRQDIEADLGEKISVEVDAHSVLRLIEIFDTARGKRFVEGDDGASATDDFVDAWCDDDIDKCVGSEEEQDRINRYQGVPEYVLTDEFSREAYERVMKQYTEARHLARTREVRGGQLFPFVDQNDDDGISFDAFFDANDHSVGYFSMLNEVAPGDNSLPHQKIGRETKIEIELAEITVKMQFGLSTVEDGIDSGLEEQHLNLSMGDLRVITFCKNDKERNLNCCMSHFDIEGNFDGQTDSVLRFLDESDVDGGLISNPSCISLMAEIAYASDNDQGHSCCQIDVTLQPLEITYQQRAFRCLTEFSLKLPHRSDSMTNSDGNQTDKSADMHFSVSCSTVILIVPCQQNLEHTYKPLFLRHGYIDHASRGRGYFCLGLELGNIIIDLSNKEIISDNTQLPSKESKAAMSCSNVILFVRGIEIERERKKRKFASLISRRVDIVAFTGDEENESTISICTQTQTSKGLSSFPIIIPLSSTKARQDMDESDDEFDDFAEAEVNNSTTGILSSDPQYILSSEANEAERHLSMNIPNIFFDLSTCEMQELSYALSSFRLPKDDTESDVRNGKSQINNMLGLALNVGQVSIVLHCSKAMESNSYSFVFDKLQIHTLLGKSGIRNVRFLCHDVTLYELSDFSSVDQIRKCPTSSDERCLRIRQRLVKSSSTIARAIAFRQKICQPLSPETPAFLVDLLLRGDEESDEMSVHINIYDVTYRYIMQSQWLHNIFALINGGQSNDDKQNAESPPSLINLFVNLSDCNLDYISPITFRNPARIIIRMGEIRFSSTIVTPSATIQAYKASISDLRLHICNYRHSYNEENARLSRAQRHFRKEDMFVPENTKFISGRNIVGLDDGLCRMDFVNVVILDRLDATIYKLGNGSRRKEPAITVSVALGKLSVSACQDSFSCLIQTYNEWFIILTAISEEELMKLRELSKVHGNQFSTQDNEVALPNNDIDDTELQTPNTKSSPPVSSSVAEQQCRDDIVMLDLTKTLLFQSYYSLDINTARQTSNQSRSIETDNFTMITRREEDDPGHTPSNDDEWATVEHGFMQKTEIPREKHEAADWILCDSQSNADSSTQSTPVKVFPQHIPIKPILDPFSRVSHVNAAKLAGTDNDPDIGIRVIVRDSSIAFRFFDGLDWVNDAPKLHERKEKPKDRRAELLSSLFDTGPSSTFDSIPLPEERNQKLQRDIARRKLSRNVHKYFQISFNGVQIKNDSFSESKEHRLASCLDFSASDFNIVETISTGDHLKMIGEWINHIYHPRDDSDGMIMLRMITKHPKLRISSDGKVMSDESRATLELLPLRCYLNQNSLRFIRNFFRKTDGDGALFNAGDDDGVVSDDGIIDIFFESFKVRPCKVKVDYQPENMDIHSFREGHYIELLNICPLEEMILTLQPTEMKNLTGWGPVFSELSSRWLEDICSTQAHKFLTRSSPFQPISNLGDPLFDLAMVLIIPEGNITAYFRGVVSGTTIFAGKVALEALSTAAKLTRFAANQLNNKALPSAPRRPKRAPRHAGDAALHAYESVARGLREANYNIVSIPLREYQNSGVRGAAGTIMRGVPIAVICPIAGASEALSYTLLGLRNQLRPDLRKEDDAFLEDYY